MDTSIMFKCGCGWQGATQPKDFACPRCMRRVLSTLAAWHCNDCGWTGHNPPLDFDYRLPEYSVAVMCANCGTRASMDQIDGPPYYANDPDRYRGDYPGYFKDGEIIP